ncbi:phosphoenolpyruvate--protein phosphotransferase [Brevibacillus ruminantium]|uniref:Phosphoenolpyruvate-protein phosphotransferase n=1 Tax=Brevibacillus ruminantium TaxID=2950604 RepID=A0ABY4WGI1_9BACL|nr:phosphoenolpyruvate--protein phosphotransferase [Brevibacillus ruminantium]USG65926.1 phosphoenolpyruvate--protein phosphotransferase [Brevibacillus ruminantium]
MIIQGIAAAPGIVIGRALVKKNDQLRYERRTVGETESAAEVGRFQRSVQASLQELEAIQEKTRLGIGEEEAKIFEAHQLFLQDPDFIGSIEEKIRGEGVNAEAALEEVRDQFVLLFESMENEYMRERAADLRDVSQRVLRNLLGVKEDAESGFSDPMVLVVHDLTPSDTAQLDREKVKGFLTDIGGRTSHSAIMARTMEIPAVVGLSTVTEQVQTGDLVIVDGLEGKVHIKPDPDLIQAYEEKQRQYAEKKETWNRLVHESTVTKDGKRVELAANIGNPQEAAQALASGAEAVGLFRTEFLYMGRDQFPTEDEQFEAYKAAAQAMGGRPVVIRTLDIGGDKELSYLSLPKELNPFLGYRAIRLCLDRPELFRTQLRALLRASVYGNIKIMYPMIATLGELRRANRMLEEAKEELQRNQIPFQTDLKVGIMIEVPAAAMIADQLAKEVDFFSIGTNDLIQYMMAADRMNEQVSYLYDPYHPAVLRMIRQVIQAAHQEGKWVGMCGEMAGEEAAIPILLGLGLDEFSMSAVSILRSRHLLKQLDHSEMRAVAEHVLSMENGEEIRAYIKEQVLSKL